MEDSFGPPPGPPLFSGDSSFDIPSTNHSYPMQMNYNYQSSANTLVGTHPMDDPMLFRTEAKSYQSI